MLSLCDHRHANVRAAAVEALAAVSHFADGYSSCGARRVQHYYQDGIQGKIPEAQNAGTLQRENTRTRDYDVIICECMPMTTCGRIDKEPYCVVALLDFVNSTKHAGCLLALDVIAATNVQGGSRVLVRSNSSISFMSSSAVIRAYFKRGRHRLKI